VLFICGDETQVVLKINPFMLNAAPSTTLFPVRIELVLKGIHPANQNFQIGERLILSK
jgi:hypothetical protein